MTKTLLSIISALNAKKYTRLELGDEQAMPNWWLLKDE